MIVCVIYLLGLFLLSAGQRRNPLWWMLIALSWLYLFPDNSTSWFSIARSFNYTFPSILILSWYLLFRKSSQGLTRNQKVLFAVVGFLAGASMEGFSLPLAGATFVYAIVMRKKLPVYIGVGFLFLWLGSATMLTSPANLSRLGGGSGISANIVKAVIYFTIDKLFWIALLLFVFCWIKRRNELKKFMNQNPIMLIAFTLTIIMSFVANTSPNSFSFIDFYSMLIGFRLLFILINDNTRTKRYVGIVSIISSVILLVFFGAHQAIIISEQIKVKEDNSQQLENYLNSPDGCVLESGAGYNKLAAPWLPYHFGKEYIYYGGIYTSFHYETLSNIYSRNTKPYVVIGRNDLLAKNMPDSFFVESRKLPGNAEMYHGDYLIWTRNSKSMDSLVYKSYVNPATPVFRLVFSLTGRDKNVVERVIKPKIVRIATNGDSIAGYELPDSRLIQINNQQDM